MDELLSTLSRRESLLALVEAEPFRPLPSDSERGVFVAVGVELCRLPPPLALALIGSLVDSKEAATNEGLVVSSLLRFASPFLCSLLPSELRLLLLLLVPPFPPRLPSRGGGDDDEARRLLDDRREVEAPLGEGGGEEDNGEAEAAADEQARICWLSPPWPTERELSRTDSAVIGTAHLGQAAVINGQSPSDGQ